MPSTRKLLISIASVVSVGLILSTTAGTAAAQSRTLPTRERTAASITLTHPVGDYTYINGKPLVLPNGDPAHAGAKVRKTDRAAQPYTNTTSCYDDSGNLRDDLTRFLYNRGASIICYANAGIESVEIGGVVNLHSGVNSGGIFANNGSQCVYQAFYAGNNYAYQTPINVCAIEIS